MLNFAKSCRGIAPALQPKSWRGNHPRFPPVPGPMPAACPISFPCRHQLLHVHTCCVFQLGCAGDAQCTTPRLQSLAKKEILPVPTADYHPQINNMSTLSRKLYLLLQLHSLGREATGSSVGQTAGRRNKNRSL